MSSPAALLRRIESVLVASGIEHMVVGSFASSVHGVPRTTHDLDIVIDPTADQLEALLAELDPEAYYVDAEVARLALRERAMFNVIDMLSGWKVDLIIRKARAFSVGELQRRRTLSLFGVSAPVATAEDTILSKLEWARAGGSQRQIDDVQAIVRVHGARLDMSYLQHWIGELGLTDEWSRIALE